MDRGYRGVLWRCDAVCKRSYARRSVISFGVILSTDWTWFWTVFSVLDTMAVAAAIVFILRRPREPRAMLAWILCLLLLPIVGLILFVILGEPRFSRTRRKRTRRRERIHPALSRQVEQIEKEHTPAPAEVDRELAPLVALATRVAGQGPTYGNAVTVLHDQKETHAAIMDAIQNAESHVHLEYYIIQPDETGRAMRDLLVAKAKQGVKCRVLVDYVGCWNWPASFRRSFKDGGVSVGFFLPVVPWRGRWRVNFRNHRKIAIIDGHLGFTGSQNIGNEYAGRRQKYGPWRDTHIGVIGPAVHRLQEVFVEDWHYATKEDIVEDNCFPQPSDEGRHIVHVIPSGPDSHANTMHHLLLSGLAAAKKTVSVVTPYFAPDTTMILALQSAAYRGVQVRLLIPSKGDNRIVLWAGRSFYQELCDTGVEVYEYDHGMLHSKVAVIDDAWAMVGSANMDQRSFRINFELTTLLYDPGLADELQYDFEALRYDARRVQPQGPQHWSFRESLQLGLARLVSPML